MYGTHVSGLNDNMQFWLSMQLGVIWNFLSLLLSYLITCGWQACKLDLGSRMTEAVVPLGVKQGYFGNIFVISAPSGYYLNKKC